MFSSSKNTIMSQLHDMPQMTTLTECMQYLKKEGYVQEFDVKEGILIDPYRNETFDTNDIAIDNFYRFEEMSNPSDNAILYAISTKNGAKGTLVDAYGTYSDESTDEFFKHVAIISKKTSK